MVWLVLFLKTCGWLFVGLLGTGRGALDCTPAYVVMFQYGLEGEAGGREAVVRAWKSVERNFFPFSHALFWNNCRKAIRCGTQYRRWSGTRKKQRWDERFGYFSIAKYSCLFPLMKSTAHFPRKRCPTFTARYGYSFFFQRENFFVN